MDSLKPLSPTYRPNRPKRPTQAVQFASVQVREYTVTLSDNPSVSCGAPIGLGWKYMEAEPLSVDQFERLYHRRRHSQAFKVKTITRTKRSQLLRLAGHSTKDIGQAAKAARQIRHERELTTLEDDYELERCCSDAWDDFMNGSTGTPGSDTSQCEI